MTDTGPALRLLSLGAGVQSTTVALLAAAGRLPKLDGAVFADTGWEPRRVYDHLERLRVEVLEPAGIPLHVVSNGNLRELTVTPGGRFTNLPLYLVAPEHEVDVLGPCPACSSPEDTDGCSRCGGTGSVAVGTRPATDRERSGMGRRSCTADHKVAPIKRRTRELLGYPHPTPVPRGVYVEQWIGISLDEVHRAKDSDVAYARHAFPLLDLKWTRADCLRYLAREGWESTPKSACVGCPFHGNRAWRELRDEHPEEWDDAVAFDAKLREPEVKAHLRLRGDPYLHSSRKPLDLAPIDRRQRDEDQTYDLLEAIRDVEWEEAEEPPGCSPFTCRSDGL